MIQTQSGKTARRVGVAAIAAVSLALMGCSTPPPPTEPPAGANAFERLVVAAQAEGEVVLIASLPEQTFAALQQGFQAEYGINLVFERLNAAPMQEKVGQEIQAGQLRTDVVAMTNDPVWVEEVSDQLSVLDVEEMPNLADLPEDQVGEQWAHGYQMYLGWAYNTDLISDEDLPEDIADWVDMDELQGRVGMPHPVVGSSYRAWHIVQHDAMGEAGYEQYLEDFLIGLNAQVGDTISPMVNQIGAGELLLAGPTHWAHSRPLANEGAPIDYLYRSPTMSMGQAFHAFSGGPHPAAAKLFINWLLSQEGQEILCGDGSCASYLDVDGEVQEPDGVEIVPADWDRAASDFGTGYIVDTFSSIAGQ